MFFKEIKDKILKNISGTNYVPAGLLDINRYFRYNEPISFDIKIEDGIFIAKSKNFRYGVIITSGSNNNDLEKNIKDAIMTSFEIPSSYEKEAAISKVGDKNTVYASA